MKINNIHKSLEPFLTDPLQKDLRLFLGSLAIELGKRWEREIEEGAKEARRMDRYQEVLGLRLPRS